MTLVPVQHNCHMVATIYTSTVLYIETILPEKVALSRLLFLGMCYKIRVNLRIMTTIISHS